MADLVSAQTAGRTEPDPASTALPLSCRVAAALAIAGCLAGLGYAVHREITAPPSAAGMVTASCVADGLRLRARASYTSDHRRWRIHDIQYRISGSIPDGDRQAQRNSVSAVVLGLGERSPNERAAYRGRFHYDSAIGEPYRIAGDLHVDRSKPVQVVFELNPAEQAIGGIGDAVGAALEGLFGAGGSRGPSCRARTPTLPVAD